MRHYKWSTESYPKPLQSDSDLHVLLYQKSSKPIQNLTDQKILFKCLCLSGSGKIINRINFLIKLCNILYKTHLKLSVIQCKFIPPQKINRWRHINRYLLVDKYINVAVYSSTKHFTKSNNSREQSSMFTFQYVYILGNFQIQQSNAQTDRYTGVAKPMLPYHKAGRQPRVSPPLPQLMLTT